MKLKRGAYVTATLIAWAGPVVDTRTLNTDDHSWHGSDPAETRSAGNLGPGASLAPKGIESTAPAGTPGERVPSREGPKGRPGDIGNAD
jgi:hypothetical protein